MLFQAMLFHALRSESGAPRIFFGAVSILFLFSAAITIAWCSSMNDMPAMPMPGGWMMSMAWMRMPDQTWPGAGAAFLGMWGVMMIAMMLPALTPVLWRVWCSVHPLRRQRVVLILTAAYFSIWIVFGAGLYCGGVIIADLTMQVPAVARTVPALGVFVIVAAGIFQFSARKKHWLSCCRDLTAHVFTAPVTIRASWAEGLRIGRHCVGACLGLTAVLLVIGVMDLAAMALVTVLIWFERWAANMHRATHINGALLMAVGFVLGLPTLAAAPLMY